MLAIKNKKMKTHTKASLKIINTLEYIYINKRERKKWSDKVMQ